MRRDVSKGRVFPAERPAPVRAETIGRSVRRSPRAASRSSLKPSASWRAGIKWSLAALALVGVGLQFLPIPSSDLLEAQSVASAGLEQAVRPEVHAILQRACKDCHSNDTDWPWYSRVAPMSWMLARHVEQGREKLNFSEWGFARRSANEIAEICDAVSNNSMPLPGYLLVHGEARLSPQDVNVICSWADEAAASSARVARPVTRPKDRKPRLTARAASLGDWPSSRQP